MLFRAIQVIAISKKIEFKFRINQRKLTMNIRKMYQPLNCRRKIRKWLINMCHSPKTKKVIQNRNWSNQFVLMESNRSKILRKVKLFTKEFWGIKVQVKRFRRLVKSSGPQLSLAWKKTLNLHVKTNHRPKKNLTKLSIS